MSNYDHVAVIWGTDNCMSAQNVDDKRPQVMHWREKYHLEAVSERTNCGICRLETFNHAEYCSMCRRRAKYIIRTICSAVDEARKDD